MKSPVVPVFLIAALLSAAPALGLFDATADVGENPKAGSVEFSPAAGEYRITGGGENMWATVDAFRFVWKRLQGDVTLTADVRFLGVSESAHRKAALIVRQGLEPDAAYADVAFHGDGHTALQYRASRGAITVGIPTPLNAQNVRIRITRRGNQFTAFVGKPGEDLQTMGPATVEMRDPVYVGLAVCSHKAGNLETAIFSNVKLETSGK